MERGPGNLNRAFALMALMSAFTPAAAGAGGSWREQSVKTEESAGLRSIRAENSRGLIRVVRGAEPEVRITALKIARGNDRTDAIKYARATQVTTLREDGKLEVRVHYPQRQRLRVSFWEMFSGFEFPRVEVRLELEVPDGIPVSLGSTSGDLETERLSGHQTIATTSGDVTIEDARGTLDASSTSGDILASGLVTARLRTVSGNVRVEQVGKVIEVRTTSGDIVIEGRLDSLRAGTVSGGIRVSGATRGLAVQTTSGDIVVDEAGGSVRAETQSGDIRLGLRHPLQRADISTQSGNIDLDVESALGCALDVSTSSGALDVSVPLQVQTVSRHTVRGTVRDGAVPVRLRSSSGDIAVRGGGN